MKSTQEMIEVMQAYVNGECIEAQFLDGSWAEVRPTAWNWNEVDYRIKKRMRTVRLFAWYDGALYYRPENFVSRHGKRVPSEDKKFEVEE